MDKHYETELDKLLAQIRSYNSNVDSTLISAAYHFAYEAHKKQLRKSGSPYFEHCLEVAKILANLKLDTATIISGLLHDVVEDTGVSLQEVEKLFGKEAAELVDGVTRIGGLKTVSTIEKQAENYRKMLLSVVRDIRVVLIKLADRLHNMRTLEFLPAKKQQEIAIETRDIYAPLAHRLGIRKIKWELEDLSLKFLNNDLYRNLARLVNEKREQRESYIQQVTAPILDTLQKNGIAARIEGRPKNLYSIYHKNKNRNVPFEKIYDLFGIRIIVKTVEECYFALGIIHNVFQPFPEKFRDYIATPRGNGYQSLHTAVFGPQNKIVEVQIRTEHMHSVAEEGVAAHWKYKEGKNKETELERHYKWLRQMVESIQEAKDEPDEVLERIKINLFDDEVFVLSPKGDLFTLPLGSSPIDFAFAVHTAIGYHCIGAKVNGKIVPLNYKLQSGDAVEIITSTNQKPSQDWLKFVRTSKARSKIKAWIKESLLEQSQKLGEEILQRALKHLHLEKSENELSDIAHTFGLSDTVQLYCAIGRGDISAQSIVRKIRPEQTESPGTSNIFTKFLDKARGSAKGVRVQGLDNLLITFGKCCQPVPGDRILGFLTQGRGVVVHRSDCKNVLQLIQNTERNLAVDWDVDPDKRFMVRLHLLGEDRKHFLRDVSEAIAQTDTNIVRIEMRAENSMVHSNIIVEVKNLQHLTRVIGRIGKVPGVLSVERLDGAGEPRVEAEVEY